MAKITIDLTLAQAAEVIKLDARKTATQIVQAHVDTWLAPLVSAQSESDKVTIAEAYRTASPATRDAVKVTLGLK